MVDATGANRAYVHHEQGWGEGPFAVTVHGDRDVWADTEDVHDRWVLRPGSQRFDSSLQELAERGWPASHAPYAPSGSSAMDAISASWPPVPFCGRAAARMRGVAVSMCSIYLARGAPQVSGRECCVPDPGYP
ncbi:hypothetical protein [Streptomyces sp. WM4235]|uniref:hypothetical protein n=1 Tax=Streptomyces sp. WM4235 TaxID=1415551 RepID=UPI00131D0E95|nr:hypothetical protein [Streptomyces sp. WM4235]